LIFVGAALFIGVVLLRVFEIGRGVSALAAPRAEDGLLVIMWLVLLVVLPYLLGSRIARFLGRSRVRFFRSYQHR
jgi:hypothetical protein